MGWMFVAVQQRIIVFKGGVVKNYIKDSSHASPSLTVVGFAAFDL